MISRTPLSCLEIVIYEMTAAKIGAKDVEITDKEKKHTV